MIKDNSQILFLLTGGTIEKIYSETKEITIFTKESDSIIQKILEKNIRVQGLEIAFQRALQKDSLDMDDADRQKILEICLETNAEKIVIVHGTSTMTKTAELLQSEKKLLEKTIVFTGAMRPYSLHEFSDASANISSALTTVQLLEKGMFLAMNGKIFSVGKVEKNTKFGIFEEK